MFRGCLSSLLFYKTLIHGDLMVIDRWRWLQRVTSHQPKGRVLDVGCGGGAFCFGLARRGFSCVGLSWDMPRMERAQSRASSIGVDGAVTFVVQDARHLDQREGWKDTFDYVVCTENIEHILDDRKLMGDMSQVLRDGGILFLTTPNKDYIPIGVGDSKTALSSTEDGGHVRVGYDEDDIHRVCGESGFHVLEIDYCSGFLSQKLTGLYRLLIAWFGIPVAWSLICPLRIMPLLFDGLLSRLLKWPGYSICLVAQKRTVTIEAAVS